LARRAFMRVITRTMPLPARCSRNSDSATSAKSFIRRPAWSNPLTCWNRLLASPRAPMRRAWNLDWIPAAFPLWTTFSFRLHFLKVARYSIFKREERAFPTPPSLIGWAKFVEPGLFAGHRDSVLTSLRSVNRWKEWLPRTCAEALEFRKRSLSS